MLATTGARLRDAVPLAELTTLRVGGPAPVADCAGTEALVATVRALDAADIPVLLVAGGSNLLVADEGFPGVVVRIANAGVRILTGADDAVAAVAGNDARAAATRTDAETGAVVATPAAGGIGVTDMPGGGDVVRVIAEAGANWDAVVAETVVAGYGGLECLSGIPGSAGATPVQNVGAYGVEVASLLTRVQLLDRASGEITWVQPSELGFGYRTSVLKHSDHAVVLAVEFALRADGSSAPLRYRELAAALGAEEGESRPAAEVRAAVLRLRAGKGMVLDPADHDTWSAGSFFTNPVVPAARVDEVRAAIAARVGPDVAVPTYPAPDGVKFSAGWLIERAGFAKGFPDESAPARLSTKHTLALTNRGAAKASDVVALARTVRDGVAERFGIRLEPEPVTVGLTL
ncbi:UDP-N-acetylmuramate dehydrogenase [Nocardia otitidiscaviarum]|uniref:UDP-N-acetylenolpyruvoylglucosamine reductase n=1 Tax=Nocardia otitidiscaviarum TaxID=1823 RepID=A0A516NYL4_9NOCA|nr:UDP-N-acetylmuramate dehydrogenase [Nocardia otitidiscaviarum]MCP9622515.1 UDP-N-acetylmuramate dehydrogenase [Nocardia otitidiscaviarum]QDP83994.1 UDP-N-acetylmuramate dehydrogenase [Nocardia otitidiscaviarum]